MPSDFYEPQINSDPRIISAQNPLLDNKLIEPIAV